uniref:Reverse transcriptase domain-containing protein n=1 Tax=Tanacetum cinerariifolium TaxID=118510 RepID=A0A6L2LHP2_TANCI|nr:reverse transcriptase domain-containing protein [Tanacetum cinerariifolium]
MADQRTMAELLRAPTEGYAEAIMVPSILAEQFELKHSLINMMTTGQFFRIEKDNPHDHIRWFNKITSTIKYKDVPNSAIKLILFPFSLSGTARRWLEKEPPRSINTWEDLVSKFINEFFPPSRTTNLRIEISNFQQWFDESFHEAWDRYKDLLRACPHHGFTELHQLNTFYNALNPADQDSLNAVAGGNLLERSTQDVLTIIENKSKVRNSRSKPVASQVKACDVNSYSSSEIVKLTHAVNQQTSDVTTAMTAMLKQFQVTPPPAPVKAVEETYVTCGGAHPYYQCLAGGLPELIPTCMTLKLANRAICTPAGIARDVFVPVGKFTFPADFVIVDYESDPRVLLILGRPFLRTSRALIDVHGEEMILCDGDERLTLNMRHDTSSYSNQPQKESINLINVFNNSSEDFLDDLFPNQPSGNPTFSPHPELTSPKVNNDIFDSEGCNVLYEKLPDLYSTKDLYPPLHDNPLKVESDAGNVYDDPFDPNGEKIKESKLLIDELDLPCDFLPPSEYDSFISQDFSRVDALPSTNNEDKIFNPGILIQEKPIEIITRVVQDKKLAISNASFVFEDFDPPFYEPLFFKEVPKSKMLPLFSSENEEKVFKPEIHTSEKVKDNKENDKIITKPDKIKSKRERGKVQTQARQSQSPVKSRKHQTSLGERPGKAWYCSGLIERYINCLYNSMLKKGAKSPDQISSTDPTLLNNSEMAAEENGDLPVLDLRTMEELCQPSLNGRGGPIAPIAIQATNFRLKNDMIQQL